MKRLKLSSALILAILSLTACGTSSPSNITNDFVTESGSESSEVDETKNDNSKNNESEKSLDSSIIPAGGSYDDSIGDTYKIGETTEIKTSDVSSGNEAKIDFMVNSVKVEKDKITSFSSEDLGTKLYPINENYVDNDLNLADGYAFVCLDVSLKSDMDIKYYINDMPIAFEYSGKWYTYEQQANSAPPEDDNGGHDTGTTELKSGEEKSLKIGYFVDESILKSESAVLDTSANETNEIWQGQQAEKHPLIDLSSEILEN